MPSSKNLTQLASLTEQLSLAQAAYLVDYQGLTTKDLNTLRAQIKQVAGQLVIAKNTLLSRALRQLPADHPIYLLDPKPYILTHATATIIANQDQLEPLKVIVKFAAIYELPTIKYGLLDHQLLDCDQVNRLAKLPGQHTLRAQVVGMLQSPLSRLVLTLNGNLQKLTIAIHQIQLQKEKQLSS